jgi:hypothetical protein
MQGKRKGPPVGETVRYDVVLLRTSASGARTARVATWSLADFNDLDDIEDDCNLAGEIRSARERFEREEAS